MQVQYSNEGGGTVRGVCGSEEKAPVAYIPVGIGGCSGLPRVQIVPGPVPCLLPAYLLTEMGSVTLDMLQSRIPQGLGGLKFGLRSALPIPIRIANANAFDVRSPLG